MIETYFATARRVNRDELRKEIDNVNHNPFISGMLQSISGVLAVLDETRQIVAVNDSFLKMLGIDNPEKSLGLRLGETIKCIHAHKPPAGCGTTKFCSTCGAAIAMVSSMEENRPVERLCALSSIMNGKKMDIALRVSSHPIVIDRKKFLIIFLMDITGQQQKAALERTFFHDVNNMLSILVGGSSLLVEKNPSDLTRNIHQASLRLLKEIAIQRYLFQDDLAHYTPEKQDIKIKHVIEELQSFFANHPVSKNKKIEFQEYPANAIINTDFSLLSRVLCNMIINALEATAVNGEIKFWIKQENNLLSFCVWNEHEIPQKIRNRIFQRNFSTKDEDGRGIGTYSMKLLGEQILGGKVKFKTSEEKGTVFKLTLPVKSIDEEKIL